MTDAPQPQSRRELRERERALAATRDSVARRGDRRAAKRIARNTVRRDAVRSAAEGRGTTARTIGSRLLSFGAMLFAAAIAIGTTVPASAVQAFFPTEDEMPATLLAQESGLVAQSLEVDAAADVTTAARDGWTVTSWAELLRQRYGTRDYSYTVGSGAIRWPFPYAVPISSGYGERVAPCRGCSTYHQGVDFNPGNGAAIFAIADGVVTAREDGYGGFGNYVTIQHIIDGDIVESTYAHMQRGSSPIVLGEEIAVGDFLGLVGATGQATGPHLHLEIKVNGETVDPFAWLQAHAS